MTMLHLLSFSHQGVYDIVANLGSLVPRFLFEPIETNFYALFAALLGSKGSTEDLSGSLASSTTPENRISAIRTLKTVLKFVTLLGFIFCVFGQSYSSLLLQLYGGTALASHAALLEAYCAYVLVLAVNGMLECFASAAMSREQVIHHNWWMIAFSAFFLVVTWLLSPAFGALGFIFANIVTMIGRILYSGWITWRFMQSHSELRTEPLWDWLPHKGVLVMLFASLPVTKYSQVEHLHPRFQKGRAIRTACSYGCTGAACTRWSIA
eukprot:m.114584 g.114584  ORF g.114584 m.114584 type:complete len:266 (-) comp9451_c0_seq7:266-1063(-)